MSYNKLFLKYGIQDNHWVGHLVMKLVDSVSYKKRKALRGGNNDKRYNFEIEVLGGGAPDKVLEGPGKTLYG